jgi:hypothetical protein
MVVVVSLTNLQLLRLLNKTGAVNCGWFLQNKIHRNALFGLIIVGKKVLFVCLIFLTFAILYFGQIYFDVPKYIQLIEFQWLSF